MGILARPQKMLRELKLPKKFSVFELGDQMLDWEGQRQSARAFYESLGCGRYECVDGNGRGTVVADLNRSLNSWEWYVSQEFDLVTDFGTGEHVFDQRQVWETVHDLTRPGGYIAFDRPMAGYPGHCFYLMQPNTIAALAHANDYEIVSFEHGRTVRGDLVRGVMRKTTDEAFCVPQQGRYFKDLLPILTEDETERGPDWKNQNVRQHSVYAQRDGRAAYYVEGDAEKLAP